MKSLILAAIRSIAMLLILPWVISHKVWSPLVGVDVSLESHSQWVSLLPGTSGDWLRTAFYRWTLAECHPTVIVGFGALISKAETRLAAHVYIGPRCILGLVTLEADVLLGPAVQIPSGPMTHGIERLDVSIRSQPGQRQRITVGRDSWIGGGSIVLADVQQQTVVGAGSIVTKPTGPRVIVVGNPARPLASRE
ncbi:Putative acetyltransferase [Roseimaritima multifibrata]|uniref:Acetyltransferase n=1 Tax=Roseimaritima multifibrata TaxID=1930274 RepID=A0A517MNB6_9BACT|nr:acyltransferase [Roseimaritima multifibrata]QDS96364.1 Putative acetyltransferase [Roseimaritima multifibrata]